MRELEVLTPESVAHMLYREAAVFARRRGCPMSYTEVRLPGCDYVNGEWRQMHEGYDFRRVARNGLEIYNEELIELAIQAMVDQGRLAMGEVDGVMVHHLRMDDPVKLVAALVPEVPLVDQLGAQLGKAIAELSAAQPFDPDTKAHIIAAMGYLRSMLDRWPQLVANQKTDTD